MSSVFLFNRFWHIGLEDLFLPSIYNVLYTVPAVVVAGFAYGGISHFDIPVGCSLAPDLQVSSCVSLLLLLAAPAHRFVFAFFSQAYALLVVILFSLATIVNLAMSIIACRTPLFKPSVAGTRFIYFGMLVWLAIFISTILGTIWYSYAVSVALLCSLSPSYFFSLSPLRITRAWRCPKTPLNMKAVSDSNDSS
jgi:hypothetical protein